MHIGREQKKVEGFCSVLKYFVLFIGGVFILLCTVVYAFQNSFAFNLSKSPAYHHPDPTYKDYYLPDQLGMTYKNLSISSSVNAEMNEEYDQLYGWFVYHEEISDKIPTIVYFHENDYFPPARLYMIEKMYKNPQKYNVIMVDYRGYGYSTGNPTEEGLYSDCRAIMDSVLRITEIDQEQIYIFGASLGGAMATYSALVYQEKVNGLILQNTIADAYQTAIYHAPYLAPIFDVALTLKLQSVERIRDIKLPMLFIVGLADHLTGPDQMYMLNDAAVLAPSKTIYEIPNCDHYLTWYYGGAEFDSQLTSFINGSNLSQEEKKLSLLEKSKRLIKKASDSAKEAINSIIE